MIQENKTWPHSLRLPFTPLMRSQGSLISPHERGSNYTKMQHDRSTQILLIVLTAKPLGSMGSSRKWKEEHHVPAGVMLFSRFQTTLGGTKNLLTHYGELPLEHLRAWEITYLHGISRASQDTAHLHLCLMNSLTQAGKDKVRL